MKKLPLHWYELVECKAKESGSITGSGPGENIQKYSFDIKCCFVMNAQASGSITGSGPGAQPGLPAATEQRGKAEERWFEFYAFWKLLLTKGDLDFFYFFDNLVSLKSIWWDVQFFYLYCKNWSFEDALPLKCLFSGDFCGHRKAIPPSVRLHT